MGIFNKIKDKNRKQIFIIDFLKEYETGKTHKNVEISFPDNSNDIIINGKRKYFDAYYVDEKGKSEDKKYYRISTADYFFWIRHEDYFDILDIMIERRRKKLTERESNKKDLNKIFSNVMYDEIDNDIYKCFIASQGGITEDICSKQDLTNVYEKISIICLEQGGRFYKSENKSAKYAIILNPGTRNSTYINYLKEKGFKVTCFENAIEFFDLQNIFDPSKLIKQVKKISQSYSK